VIFEVLTAVSSNITTFLDVTPCSLVDAYQRFEKTATFWGNLFPSSVPKLEEAGLPKRAYLCTDLHCVTLKTVILSRRLLLTRPVAK
jgi:hypothetical protein